MKKILLSLLALTACTQAPTLADQDQHVEGGMDAWLDPIALDYFANTKDRTIGGQMGQLPKLTEDSVLVDLEPDTDQILAQIMSMPLDRFATIEFDGTIDWTDPATGSTERIQSGRVCGGTYWQKSLTDPLNRICPFQMCCTFTLLPTFPYLRVECQRVQVSTLCRARG
jgi:hypothetical protein